jgi:hypothetical protein
VEQVPINAQTFAGATTDAAASPGAVRGALASATAEFAVLLLRVSAVAVLSSPILLAAALLLG